MTLIERDGEERREKNRHGLEAMKIKRRIRRRSTIRITTMVPCIAMAIESSKQKGRERSGASEKNGSLYNGRI